MTQDAAGRVHLKGQLHAHSTLSDGRLTPQQVADTYASLGFDFVVFADHDHLLKPTYRQSIEAVQTSLLVFVGIELTIATRWGYVHVTRAEGAQERLYIFNHPGDYDLSMRQTLECIEDIQRELKLDAVEVTHHGFYTPEFDVPALAFPKVASDDSHAAHACGRAWIELDARRDKDDIIQAIRRGEAVCCYAKGHTNALMIA